MIENYQVLRQKVKTKKLDDSDLFLLTEDEDGLPAEVRDSLKRIEKLDLYEFKEGLDSESHSFIYKNALNQFKYENDVSIHFLFFDQFF